MRTIGVKLTADTTGYISGLGRASAATKDFTGQLDKASKNGHLDKVGDQALKFGIAGAAAFGMVVKSAADFDKQMSAVSAATHANTKDMAALRAAALQAGKDTQYSATEAAKGITELSKAGVSTADVLGGGLKGALSLAAAGQLSVGEAAETAASAMTQFKLSGDQVPHVADLLAAAAGKAQGSVHDLGYALSQSGLVASQMGLSIEDATGTLAAFASAGLIGSDAGTSFKTMLLSLQNPVPKTAEMMKDLGISAYDAQGNFVGIAKFAGILQEKLSNLTPQVRQQALAQMFGNDAVRAGTILYSQGATGIQKWIDKTNDAGYAASTAAKLTDNLSGDIERLKGSLETLAIQSGSGPNSGLRVLAKSLNAVVNSFLNLPPAVGSTVTVLAGVGGAALLSLAAFVKVRKGIAEAATQLNAMGPAGEKAAVGLGRAASAAGKAAAVFAVWQAAMAAADAIQGNTVTNVDAMTVGLKKFGQGAELSGEAARVLGGNLDNLTTGFQYLADADNGRRKVVKGLQEALEKVTPGLAGYAKSLTNTQDQVDAIDQSLASMVSSGHAADAAAAFQRLTQILAVNGVTVEEVRKQFPGYAAAVEQAGGSTVKLGHAMNFMGPTVDEAAAAMNGATGAAKGTKGGLAGMGKQAAMSADEVKKITDAIDAFITGALSADRAAIAFKSGQVTLSKELKDGTRTLSINTVEGRKNRLAVDDQISAINELRKSRLAQGGALDVVNKKYLKDIDGLRRSMLQAGFSKKAVDELIGTYKKIPGSVNTKVSVTGDAAVLTRLRTLNIMQNALKKGVSISTSAARALAGDSKAAKDRGVFAEGGYTGPGPKYQPAGVVHAGEYVFSAEATKKLGVGQLEQMHQSARTPGYAGGGLVTWPFPTTAAMTRVPSKQEAMNAVIPAGPTGGGMTYKWIEALVASRFPGLHAISDFRPGAVTLSGNRSYHAVGRAVDFPPSHALAKFFHDNYMARLKELITPWNELNVWNGRPHRYTGAIWNQHNFAGGNAHDHVAMRNGGIIPEPVFGVGASGRTYSFAENGPEQVLPNYATTTHGWGRGGGNTYQITISPTPLAHPRDIGREVVGAIQAYEQGSGRTWRTGRNAV
jgi:TP901 family phage tail tape measure protein